MKLTPRQGTQFDQFNQLLGLRPSETSRAAGTTDFLLSEDSANSALPPISVKLDSLEELQAILRQTPRAVNDETPAIPSRWDKRINLEKLSGQQEKLLQQALFLHLTDHPELADSYTEALEERFFPLPALAFAAKDVTLGPGEKLNITPENGHNPVIVNIGTLKMAPGSQIVCTCPVILNVQLFINS
jgi:hypothetical protein